MDRNFSIPGAIAILLLAGSSLLLYARAAALKGQVRLLEERMEIVEKKHQNVEVPLLRQSVNDLSVNVRKMEEDLARLLPSEMEEDKFQARVLAVLKEHRPGPWRQPRMAAPEPTFRDGPALGVYLNDLNDEEAETLKVPGGSRAVIEGLIENGPAAVASLREADVVLDINGQKIANADELRRYIQGRKAGDVLAFTYFRGGETRKADVKLMNAHELRGVRTPHGDTVLQDVLRKLEAGDEATLSVLKVFAEESKARTPKVKEVIRKIGGEVSENLSEKAALAYRDFELLAEKANLLAEAERNTLLQNIHEMERKIMQTLPAEKRQKFDEEFSLFKRATKPKEDGKEEPKPKQPE